MYVGAVKGSKGRLFSTPAKDTVLMRREVHVVPFLEVPAMTSNVSVGLIR
jgi:hypothetical protein